MLTETRQQTVHQTHTHAHAQTKNKSHKIDKK